MKTTIAVIVLALSGLGGCASGTTDAGNARLNDPNRQQRVNDPTDDGPSAPRDTMGGKGKGSETKWDRKINH